MTTVRPLMHKGRLLARGYWFNCISHCYMPHELDGDRYDLSVEPVGGGPLDAPDFLAAGSCYSDLDPFFCDEPFTDMHTVERCAP